MQFPVSEPESLCTYYICVREPLDHEQVLWLHPLRIEYKIATTVDDVTTLVGPVRDQAELHGLLMKIWALNLTLIFLQCDRQHSSARR